jgi:hypothetical protein
MAEVLGALEVALATTEVLKLLYKYISAVKGAKDDIRKLTEELFALKGALEHFDMQAKSDVETPMSQEVQGMLKMTYDTLKAIHKKLGNSNRGTIGRAVQSLSWPFRSGDIDKYLVTLERAKTWFIMVIMRDSTETTSAMYSEVQRLSTAVHEDIILRRVDTMLKEADEAMKWLSPVNSADELARACKDKLPGTGLWIWDLQFAGWENDLETQPFFWIAGKCTCNEASQTLELAYHLSQRS